MRLRPLHRPALVAHFLRLDPEDRRLRFGASIADEAIGEYVARIDFDRDGVFAVQDDELELVAVVHVAPGALPELGLSVLPHARGQGLGAALLQRAVTFLRNRGAREVFVHCLTENGAMMHLARKSGMRIVAEGPETDARLALEPASAATFVAEWIEDQQAQALQALRRNALVARTLCAPFARAASRK